MDLAGEKRADRQHHPRRADRQTHLRDDTSDAAVLDHEVVDRLLEDFEIRLPLDDAPDRGLVQRAIGLAARRAHRGTFRRIQCAPLDAREIRRVRHRAAQRIDLFHEVPFADPANRGIATHLSDRLDVVGEQQRARTAARGCERGFGARVTTAYDNYVVLHHLEILDLCCGHRRSLRSNILFSPSDPALGSLPRALNGELPLATRENSVSPRVTTAYDNYVVLHHLEILDLCCGHRRSLRSNILFSPSDPALGSLPRALNGELPLATRENSVSPRVTTAYDNYVVLHHLEILDLCCGHRRSLRS